MLHNAPQLDPEWQPIDTVPENQEVRFGGMVYASAAGNANGSSDIWCEGVGLKVVLSAHIRPIFTGILGGNPTHWRPA